MRRSGGRRLATVLIMVGVLAAPGGIPTRARAAAPAAGAGGCGLLHHLPGAGDVDRPPVSVGERRSPGALPGADGADEPRQLLLSSGGASSGNGLAGHRGSGRRRG